MLRRITKWLRTNSFIFIHTVLIFKVWRHCFKHCGKLSIRPGYLASKMCWLISFVPTWNFMHSSHSIQLSLWYNNSKSYKKRSTSLDFFSSNDLANISTSIESVVAKSKMIKTVKMWKKSINQSPVAKEDKDRITTSFARHALLCFVFIFVAFCRNF